MQELDLTTLERVNASFVADDLRAREDDVIWRVQLRERWVYVYLLLEFQSTVDTWMALRLLVYMGLLYQDLIRSEMVKGGERLPAVFPVVLYNGRRKWTAARELTALIDVPPGLSAYQPNLRYWLLEERSIPPEALARNNTVAHIVRIEQTRCPEELRQIVEDLNAQLREPRFAELRRALTIWIRHVVLQRWAPGAALPEVQDLQEVETMLAETVEEWVEQWKREGLEQGQRQGLQEGLQEGLKQGLQEGL